AHLASQAQVVVGVGRRLVELGCSRIDRDQIEAGRRHVAHDRHDAVGLLGGEQDLGGHRSLLQGCASGIVAVTTGSGLTTRVVWPFPVVSSTRRASPGPKTCLEPSPSPISSWPDRMTTN